MVVPSSRSPFLVLLGCGFCLASLPLHAQRAPLNPPATPNSSLPQVPGDTVPGTTAANESTVGRLYFINSPVVDILHSYEQYSGKHVLYDTSVTGSITIDVENITRTDALRIIETALNLNGFALVPSDNNIVKVIGLNKQARASGVSIYSDLSTVPDTEGIVTFLVRLRYLDPQETAGVLGQLIPLNPNTVNFTALKSAGALLITDTARNVRRFVSLINQLDVPASPVTERFIALKRAEAAKAVEFLNGVFDIKSGGSTPGQPGAGAAVTGNQPNNRRPIRRIGEDGQPVEVPGLIGFNNGSNGLPLLSGESLIQGRITLTADIRTNRVHVVTSPVNMPLVERLLEEYDADTPFAQPVRFPLRFVTAGDMLPILVDSLKEQGSEGGNSPTSGASTPSPSRSSSGNNSFFGNNSNSSNGSSGSLNGGSSGNSNFGDDNNAPEVDTRPTEATVGNNRLIADQRTNTIILLGGADAKSKVSEILNELDKRTPQVIIRTVIGELSLDNNHELGFQYLLRSNRGSLLSNFNSGQLGQTSTVTPAASPSGSPTTTTATSALNTFSTLAAGLGSSFTGVGGIIAIGKNLDLIVSALDASNRFKTISTPRIVTQNNKRAYISSGTKIAIAENSLSSLTTSGNSTGISSTTTYIDVLLKLSVTPLINSEKEVSLDISQQLNSLAGSSNNINGSTAPNINTRELKNYVTARNGETIYLGGLITQSDNKTSSDIPYLSRIPVLGELFKTKTRDGSRSELIILLHPEVVATADSMDNLREREENRTYLGHDLENQLLPADLPVRKALPVNGKVTTYQSTTNTTALDDKLHPVRKTLVKTRTTTVSPGQ